MHGWPLLYQSFLESSVQQLKLGLGHAMIPSLQRVQWQSCERDRQMCIESCKNIFFIWLYMCIWTCRLCGSLVVTSHGSKQLTWRAKEGMQHRNVILKLSTTFWYCFGFHYLYKIVSAFINSDRCTVLAQTPAGLNCHPQSLAVWPRLKGSQCDCQCCKYNYSVIHRWKYWSKFAPFP